MRTNGARPKPEADTQPVDRRELILRALYGCILDKGYTKTSLTDIAVRAGMSPSHIRYYFDGKDAILELYLAKACERILTGIRQIDAEQSPEWLERFADYFIGHPKITPDRLSVMVEIFGISVHDPELRKIKTAYDSEIRQILEGYFRWAGCADGLDPSTAAEIAQALEAGLKYNGVFQQEFSPEHARSVFIASMQRLSGASRG